MTPKARSCVVALAVCAGLSGCAREAHSPQIAASPTRASSRPASPKSSPANVPIEVSSHKIGSKYILLTVQKNNRKSYVLRADSESGRYFGQDSGSSTFVNPHITFYTAAGKRVVADAPAGTVVEKDKTVLMSGGVHARAQDGMTLTSDTLRYDDEGQTAHGAGHVVVTSARGETLQGETVDWNLRDGRIDVTGAR